jgi:hypothetical protein
MSSIACAAVTAWLVSSSLSVPSTSLVAVDKPLFAETVAMVVLLHPASRIVGMDIRINRMIIFLFMKAPFYSAGLRYPPPFKV